MAESIVQVTEGSGKKLHTFNRTIGANSVEDEVVLFGENYLASYQGNGDASAAVINTQLVGLMAGASLKVRIRRIEIHQLALATTAALMSLAVYRLTTAGTGGTTTTPTPLDPTDAASGATVRLVAAVGGTLGALVWAGNPYLLQTVGASAPFVQPIVSIDFDRLRSKPLIIAAGAANGIAIVNLTAHLAASLRFDIWFDESNF